MGLACFRSARNASALLALALVGALNSQPSTASKVARACQRHGLHGRFVEGCKVLPTTVPFHPLLAGAFAKQQSMLRAAVQNANDPNGIASLLSPTRADKLVLKDIQTRLGMNE